VVTNKTMIVKIHSEIQGDAILNVRQNIKRLRKRIAGTGLTIKTHWDLGYEMQSDGSFRFPWDTSCGAAQQRSVALDFYLEQLEQHARLEGRVHLVSTA